MNLVLAIYLIVSNPWLQVIIRVIFYYLISLLAVKLAKAQTNCRAPTSTNFAKPFELHSTILKKKPSRYFDIALALGRYADLILPLNLILIGLVYNLFCQILIKLLSYVSWSYIYGHVVAIGLNNYLGSNALIAELYHLGITYIVMGLF